ncbi:MAG: TIGR01777 family protein [Planctomycetes bacterium]|nr:TIGR01777 family protein [Planctomycetota bacterium]
MNKRVLITGGSGFVGRTLCGTLLKSNYEVVVLSRGGARSAGLPEQVTVLQWDDHWSDIVDGAEAIVNLAGESIASRWTKKKKQRIVSSRIDMTHAIAEAISRAKQKPRVVIQASAIGYYGNRQDEPLDETSSQGDGFLAELCQQWEAAIEGITEQGVRLVTARIGVVLGRDGGILGQVVKPFRFFAGGCPGSGRDWLSWIHIEDLAAAVQFFIERDDLEGIFNLTTPEPIPTKIFYQTLARIIHRPCWAPLPGWLLKPALGEMAKEMILTSQKVMPNRLLKAAFPFQYPKANDALNHLLGD